MEPIVLSSKCLIGPNPAIIHRFSQGHDNFSRLKYWTRSLWFQHHIYVCQPLLSFPTQNYASVAIAKLTAKAAMYVGLFVPHKKVGRNNTYVGYYCNTKRATLLQYMYVQYIFLGPVHRLETSLHCRLVAPNLAQPPISTLSHLAYYGIPQKGIKVWGAT